MKLVATSAQRDFALTNAENKRLPKRSNGTVGIIVNGNPVIAPVTNNRAWTGTAADALEYIWIEIDGVAKYITLSYGELASSFAGEEFQTADGTGPKPPLRRTATAQAGLREFGREQAFKATWATR